MRQPEWAGGQGLMGGSNRKRTRGRRSARVAVEGLEGRALLSTITEYPTVSTHAGPQAETVGVDGNIYFAEYNKGAIGVLNTTTGATSEVTIPTTGAKPFGITTGPGGLIYFTEPTLSAIGVYNPANDTFHQFSTVTSAAQPQLITLGSDGNIYFTEVQANKIGEFNVSTSTLSEIPVLTSGAQPYGITSGPDGNIYFTEESGNNIGEYNLTSHVVTETPVPTASSQPLQITTGPDGNIWFTEYNVGQIGEYNLTSHAVTSYPTGAAPSSPTGITSGPDGLIYFTDEAANTLSTIDPTTHATTSLPIPSANSQSYGILTAPDGNVYFTESSASNIGKLALSTNLVFTTEPVATVTAGTFLTVTVKDEYATGVVDAAFSGNVAMALASNPAGGVLTGTLTEAASLGVATFPDLLVTKAGSGYVLGASATGFASILSSGFAVTPAAASQLVVVSEPPSSMLVGSTFGVAAAVVDPYGNIETSYSGNVALSFGVNPSGATLAGTTTVAVGGGYAQFPGLSIATPGTGYVLDAIAPGLTAGATSPFTVVAPPPPPPVVLSEQLLFTRRFNKKGKPIGKPIFVGYQFNYSTTMFAPSAGSPGNYQVDSIQIKKVHRQIVRILHPVAFSVNYVAQTNSVQILLRGRPPFPKGGQITLVAAPPTGIESAAAVFLDGNNEGVAGDNGVFQIGPHSRYIN